MGKTEQEIAFLKSKAMVIKMFTQIVRYKEVIDQTQNNSKIIHTNHFYW